MTPLMTALLTYGAVLVAAVGALGLDAFGRRSSAIAASSAGLVVALVAGAYAGITRPTPDSIGSLAVGGPASLVFAVISCVGLVAVLGGRDALLERENGGSIGALIALGVAAAGATAAAVDLVTLLLVLETSALAGYALVMTGRTTRSSEAAMKYFVQGAVATGLFVFGLAVLVGLLEPTGEYVRLGTSLANAAEPIASLVGVALVLSALVFKMGAAPFHSWAPDVYETAPAESAAFLASGPKLAAIAAAAILVGSASGSAGSSNTAIVVAVLSVVSVLVGSIGALRQTDYRRLLAYAGIAQSGYALLAVAIGAAPLAAFFASTYALAASGTFLAADAFKRLRPDWDGTVAGLAGLGRRAPLLSGAVSLLLVSLAGIPPLLGFWAKLVVFATAVSAALSVAQSSPPIALALAVGVAVAILGSVISLGYYGSILRSLFFDESPAENPGETATSRTGGSAARAVVVVAAVVALLSLVPFLIGATRFVEFFSAR